MLKITMSDSESYRLINFALPPEYLSPCTLIFNEA